MSCARRVLPLALAVLLLGAASSSAGTPPRRLPAGLSVGVYSGAGAAAAERAQGGFGLRTLYVTGGVAHGTAHDPGSEGADGLRDWLRESAAAHEVPVLTYYQLQSSARSGAPGRARLAAGLRDVSVMRSYWRDVRATMKLAAADPRQLVVLHVEPDGWEFMEQLRGVRTPAMVAATGMSELRGLPNDVRGFARAFARLRDRYAPNVALAYHLSPWGVGQDGTPSVANFRSIAHARERFLAGLGMRFDLALSELGGSFEARQFDAESFAQHLALMREFHAVSGLPLVLFQVPVDAHVDWLLGPSAASRAHLRAERAAGVVGLLFDAGSPEDPAPGRNGLLRAAAAARAAGALG